VGGGGPAEGGRGWGRGGGGRTWEGVGGGGAHRSAAPAAAAMPRAVRASNWAWTPGQWASARPRGAARSRRERGPATGTAGGPPATVNATGRCNRMAGDRGAAGLGLRGGSVTAAVVSSPPLPSCGAAVRRRGARHPSRRDPRAAAPSRCPLHSRRDPGRGPRGRSAGQGRATRRRRAHRWRRRARPDPGPNPNSPGGEAAQADGGQRARSTPRFASGVRRDRVGKPVPAPPALPGRHGRDV
jgi:hypothetical protein